RFSRCEQGHVQPPDHGAGGGPSASRRTKPASSRIGTPSCSALSALVPAFSPTTTKSVFFDTEPEALPPRLRTASFASSREKPVSEPVTTTVRPASVL